MSDPPSFSHAGLRRGDVSNITELFGAAASTTIPGLNHRYVARAGAHAVTLQPSINFTRSPAAVCLIVFASNASGALRRATG